jgi:hypothetical protein
MGKTKLTLSVEEDLLRRAKGFAAREGLSISGLVEEFLRGLVATESLDKVAQELGLGDLSLVNKGDVPRIRSKGLDAAEIMREMRRGRMERLGGS